MKTFKDFINEMSRPRKDAVRYVEGVQSTVQEHLWKVYAYGDDNKNDVTGWYISLSKHVKRFRVMNVGKKSPNLTKPYLMKKFVDELFEVQDVKQLATMFTDDYGKLNTHLLVATKEIRIIAERYVEFMLDKESTTTKVNHSKVFNENI